MLLCFLFVRAYAVHWLAYPTKFVWDLPCSSSRCKPRSRRWCDLFLHVFIRNAVFFAAPSAERLG